MKQCEKINVTIWGKEHCLEVRASGSHGIHDERFENPDSDLLPDELEQLNWFVNSGILDNELKSKAIDYCNERYEDIGEPPISEIFPEVELTDIYITKKKSEVNPFHLAEDIDWEKAKEWETAYTGTYDDYIAILGYCEHDEEHGISIIFKNKEFSCFGQSADLY
jgi:hypothetical protein